MFQLYSLNHYTLESNTLFPYKKNLLNAKQRKKKINLGLELRRTETKDI